MNVSEREDSSKNCASVKKRIIFLLLSVIIFLSLSAIQLLPFLELSHYSIRISGFNYREATTWSMDLKDLWQFFIPDPYGYGTSEQKYWSNQSWLKSIYLGTIPFILSTFFFIEKGKKTLPFVFIVLCAVSLALGKNTVIYEYLYYYLPFFNKIRYPVKFLFLFFILISVSSGLGWDCLKRNLEEGKKSGKWIIFGLLCLATLATIAFGGLSYFDKEVKEFLIAKGIKYPEYNEVYINLFNTKRLFVIFILTALMLYGSFRYIKARTILPYLIVSILTIDLFFAHSGYYFTSKAEEYHKGSESMGFIQQDREGPFRILVTPKTKKGTIVASSTANNKNDTTSSSYGLEKELIHGYNMERRIFDIEGMEVMRLLDYEKILAFLTMAPRIDSTNLLAILNVKYVLSVPKIQSDEFKLVKIIRPEPGKDQKTLEKEGFLKIYQNLNYLPRAFLVERYRIVTKVEEYWELMSSKKYRPSEEVLLYEEPWAEETSGVGNSKLKIQNLKPDKKAEDKTSKNEVEVLNYRNNNIELSVNTDRPKILVLSETYYPGWKVYVDGQEKKVLKANFAFRAVTLSAGKHKVEFIYEPWTFKVGAAITLFTIVLLIGIGVKAIVRANNPAHPPQADGLIDCKGR